MGRRWLVFVLCVILYSTREVIGKDVWEFGVDAPGSIIVDHKVGSFSLFQKNKDIKLRTPQCYVMEYVRAQVDNSISEPTVTYDNKTNIVSISYKPFQISVSDYNIIAKAERKPGCFNQSLELQMRHKFG